MNVRRQMLVLVLLMGLAACSAEGGEKSADEAALYRAQESIARQDGIPNGRIKYHPETDDYPPQLHSQDFSMPQPVPGLINTAGAEDSPFITPDGTSLYFFFTPDVSIPVVDQVRDGLTGIYVSQFSGGSWGAAQRVWLQEPGKLALDGCAFIQDDTIWYCTAREGYTGLHWFEARRHEQGWADWRPAIFDELGYIGELHMSVDEQTMVFHADIPGGQGGLDIWQLKREGIVWSDLKNLSELNSPADEGWPFLSIDGRETWFLRTWDGSPALFRARLDDGHYQAPELIISQFAGEPSLDAAGNLYFVHHFVKDGVIQEADIYVAYRK